MPPLRWRGPFSQILFAGLRFALAGLLLLAVLTVRGRRVPVPPKGSRLSVLRLGLVLTAGQYFFFYLGLANTTGVRGSIIQGMGTFLTVVLAHFWFHGKDGDRMTGRKALGCIVGLLGVVLANFEGTQGGFSFSGEGLMLLATVLFAVGSLFSKDVTKTVDPVLRDGLAAAFGRACLNAYRASRRRTPLRAGLFFRLGHFPVLSGPVERRVRHLGRGCCRSLPPAALRSTIS